MTRTSHRSLLNLVSSSILKSVYKTTVRLTIFRGNIHSCRVLQKCPIISLEKSMPVITAVAVAAHRQNHHLSSLPHDAYETQSQFVCRKFRLLSCGSLDAPFNPIMRSSSFAGRKIIFSDAEKARPILPLREVVGRRNYVKGKDKPHTKKGVVNINEEEMKEILDVDSLKKQLDKLIEQMKEEFAKQLNIRGAAGALETLHVHFEGEVYPLQELAQVGRKNPQLAVLNLASLPDAIQPVLHAIRESGMNLNPQQEGTTIYVPLPKVTREHRESLAKNAKAIFNKYKASLQAVQNKFVKQCKSQKDVSEDLSFSVQQQIMKMTEIYIANAEKLLQSKQSELLEQK